jgi:hypothetical protein
VDIEIDLEIPRGRAPVFDRRTYSPDGFLTATDCVISAAQVNDYIGAEIPNAEALGLDLQRLYRVWREPEALRAAVPLMDGIPLLVEHSIINAANFDRVPVGTIHDCRWDADSGRVLGSVSVWMQPAIDDIETKVRSDLSLGYFFRPVLGAGRTPSGVAYDLRMSDIKPQHCAIVVDGRVSGAAISDSQPRRAAPRAVTVDTATALRIIAEERNRRDPVETLIPHIGRLRR